MKKFLIAVIALYLLSTASFAETGGNPPPVRTRAQTALHEAADHLRAAGYSDDSAPIRVLSNEWWAEQDKLNVLAKVVEYEAGDCPWEHRVAVAVVVLNRVKDDRFPDTVREVVEQPGQYHPGYTSNFSKVRRSSYEAAAAALNGEHNVPTDVVWQAQFPQGDSVWWESYVDTGWYRSTTYFCR